MANPTNAVATIDMQALAQDTGFDRRRLELIKARYFVENAPDEEFELFMTQASRRGLDPTRKHIYAVERYDSQKKRNVISHQVSIDGQRLLAERTGRYEGQTAPQWCGPDGQWREVWLEDGPPAAARIGVYRKGFRDPIYAVVRYGSFVQTKNVWVNGKKTDEVEPTKFWRDMPDHMLAKVAEAQALRRAFPEDLGGIYTAEEMGQADNPAPIESHGRVVDRSTGEITATVEEPDPEADLKHAKRDLWELVKGWGWSGDDLDLVVADTYGDQGITTAGQLDTEQLQAMRRELDATEPDARDELIGMLRKGVAA
ncbi:phage recombination protein Bet [Mycolicibacterium sp.]|uniref:phage recombination protein Bet n=1 Tax=Mycolicibacterium sp. TaxID=2320850 RepID=UPI00355CDCC1